VIHRRHARPRLQWAQGIAGSAPDPQYRQGGKRAAVMKRSAHGEMREGGDRAAGMTFAGMVGEWQDRQTPRLLRVLARRWPWRSRF
jgi:hypothetical protein